MLYLDWKSVIGSFDSEIERFHPGSFGLKEEGKKPYQ